MSQQHRIGMRQGNGGKLFRGLPNTRMHVEMRKAGLCSLLGGKLLFSCEGYGGTAAEL